MYICKFRKAVLVKLTMLLMSSHLAIMHAEEYYELGSCPQWDNGLTAYGEILYWKIAQDQMQYAATIPGGIQPLIEEFFQADPVRISADAIIAEPNFAYRPGVRLGFSYEIPCCNWNVGLIWTSIAQHTTSRVFDSSNGVIPLATPVAALFGFIGRDPTEFGFGTEATSRWDFQFNTLDIQLAKNFCSSESVDFLPYIGVKGASIEQSQRIEYFGFSVEDAPIAIGTKKKNNFYAAGPSFGFASYWEFCDCWKLSGNLSTAFLAGRFDVHEHPRAELGPNLISAHAHNKKRSRIRPMVNANIGLDWNIYMCNRFEIFMSLSYEMQYWWNQWQAPSSVISTLVSSGSSSQGDLMIYGASAMFGILW